MSQARCLRGLVLSMSLLLVPLTSGVCLAEEAVTAAKIVKAWRDNERTLENVRISWKTMVQQPFEAKAAADLAKGQPPRLNESRAERHPASLILSGDKYRYTAVGFWTQQGVTKPTTVVTTFDSKLAYKLHEGVDGAPALGTIARQPSSNLGVVGPLMAVNVVFRPYASGILSEADVPQVDSDATEIEGRPCSLVTYPHAQQRGVQVKLWIDNATLTPLRVHFHREGVPESMATLKYEGEPTPASLSEWDYVLLSFGRLMEAGFATGVKVDRTYQPAEKDFVIDFPEGTHVVDKRSGKEIHLRSNGNGEFEPWAPK